MTRASNFYVRDPAQNNRLVPVDHDPRPMASAADQAKTVPRAPKPNHSPQVLASVLQRMK